MRSRFDAAYFENPAVVKDAAAAAAYADLLAGFVTGGRVVDLGCATGTLLELFDERGYTALGLDISVEALAAASGGVACAGTEAVPLATGSCDAAMLLDVIEHLDSPAAALVEAHRVVRPGGVLVVSTPNASSPLRVLLGRRWHGLSDPTHLYFFGRFTLHHLLRMTGWEPMKTLTRSGAPTALGRLLSATNTGGELCVVARRTSGPVAVASVS